MLPTPEDYTPTSLNDFWLKALGADGQPPCQAIATDIASFTGESPADVLGKMALGKEAFRDLWLQQRVDPNDARAVQEFYKGQFVEAYELANWHCGRTNGEFPLNYAYAASLARDAGRRRVLDFGSGIGTGCLCFGSVGCEVDAADVADRLLEFTVHRARRHGYSITPIHLYAGEMPRGPYDLITCFDVLEHIPDQRQKLNDLSDLLCKGGLLVTNLMDDSFHEDRPMHVSSAGSSLALVRQTALSPVWSWWRADLQLLEKGTWSSLRNRMGRWRDRLQGVP